jgi:hypothetical protein
VQRGFEASWLSMIFSKAVFLGNGLVAIVSGLLANYLVDDMQLGPTAPFDAAAVLLAVGGVVVHTTWTENYGEASEHGTLLQSFGKAAKAIASDRKVFLLGAMQALFEGSMYTFVFLWTPALSPNGEDIPHGCVRACMRPSLARRSTHMDAHFDLRVVRRESSVSRSMLRNQNPFALPIQHTSTYVGSA